MQLSLLKGNITHDALMHHKNIELTMNNLPAMSFDYLSLENSRIKDEMSDLDKFFKNIKREFFSIYKNGEKDYLIAIL